jgi:2-octaprenyl-6-methoxyphenol hydroxylase
MRENPSQDTHQNAPPAIPYTCLISGAGPVGMMLALHLHREGISVALCDSSLALEERFEPRAYALSPSSRDLLEDCNLWQELNKQAEAVLSMRIGESVQEDAVRLVYLTLDSQMPHIPLAWILEGDLLIKVMRRACRDSGVTLFSSCVNEIEFNPTRVDAVLADGKKIIAKLAVAADGQFSSLREKAGIRRVCHDYGQEGIVAVLRHERPHNSAATQIFFPTGPLALLPLPSKDGVFRSALVWSQERMAARAVCALPPEAFTERLWQQAGGEWGEFSLEMGPVCFPLSLGLARRWIIPRLALVGDAAHRVHPLAGQGLNLGFADAAVLAQHIIKACRLGLDPAHYEGLLAYERERRPAAVAMAALTGGLNQLFSIENPLLVLARRTGLGLVSRNSWLRKLLVSQAA